MAKSVIKVKTQFNHREMDQAQRRSKVRFFGAAGKAVAETAVASIVKADGPSRPGRPPHGHGRQLLRMMGAAYDSQSDREVIGPINLNHTFEGRDGEPVQGTVPSVLEKGGEVFVLEVYKFGRWRRIDLRTARNNAGLPTRLRKVKVAARPFMGPALQKVTPRLAQMTRGTFRKG